jgi:hypothetical protein
MLSDYANIIAPVIAIINSVIAVSSSHFKVLPDVPCPLPRRIKQVRVSIASLLTRPSPIGRRVGIRIVTFENATED